MLSDRLLWLLLLMESCPVVVEVDTVKLNLFLQSAMAAAAVVAVRVLCPSVRPFVTLWYHVETTEPVNLALNVMW